MPGSGLLQLRGRPSDERVSGSPLVARRRHGRATGERLHQGVEVAIEGEAALHLARLIASEDHVAHSDLSGLTVRLEICCFT